MALKRSPSKTPTQRIDEAWGEIEDLVSKSIEPFDLKKSDETRLALDMLARIKTAVEAALASTAPAPGVPAPTATTPTGTTPLAPPPLPATRPAASSGIKLSFGRRRAPVPAGAPTTP